MLLSSRCHTTACYFLPQLLRRIKSCTLLLIQTGLVERMACCTWSLLNFSIGYKRAQFILIHRDKHVLVLDPTCLCTKNSFRRLFFALRAAQHGKTKNCRRYGHPFVLTNATIADGDTVKYIMPWTLLLAVFFVATYCARFAIPP